MPSHYDGKRMSRTLQKARLSKSAIAGALTLAAMLSLFVSGCAAQTTQQNNQTPTTSSNSSSSVGDIVVTPIMHASVQIEYGGKVIQVDPTSAGDYSKAKQADLILVTDIHGDHLDPAAISRLRKTAGLVVAPAAAAPKIENPTVMANGESINIEGFGLEAVPMYNLKRGPSEGQFFHTKGRGNGYILTLGSKRVYIA